MSDSSKSRNAVPAGKRAGARVIVIAGGRAVRLRHWTALVKWQPSLDASRMQARALACEDPRDELLRCHRDGPWN